MDWPYDNARWVLAHYEHGGHRYFYDLRQDYRKIAVADQSGLWPEETRDGILYLDTSRPITCDEEGYWHVPLVDLDMREISTPTSPLEARRVADRFGMQIKTPDLILPDD